MNRSEGQWTQPELSSTVFRGLKNSPNSDTGLGMHWSTDPKVARSFAGQFGTVLHGEVPISAIETDPQVLKNKGVNSRNEEQLDPESELPIKAGSTVQVTGRTNGGRKWTDVPKWVDKHSGPWKAHYANSIMSRNRTRTYNPPREMTA